MGKKVVLKLFGTRRISGREGFMDGRMECGPSPRKCTLVSHVLAERRNSLLAVFVEFPPFMGWVAKQIKGNP